MEAITKVKQFLKDAGVFYIATVDGDRPRVRPFGAVCEFEGKLYIPTNNQKNVFAQMKANPHIEISTLCQCKWIRLEAEVVCDTRREARKAMLDEYSETLTKMYSLDDGIFEVLYLKNAKATFCSFTESPETVEF